MIGENVSYTLATRQDQTLIQPMPIKGDTTPKGGNPNDPAYTLRSRENGGGINDCIAYSEYGEYIVRRLTPTECERLQGFPDDWTKVSYRGKSADECPDGPRYKAIGNSMAVPVMRWLGERIDMVNAIRTEHS